MPEGAGKEELIIHEEFPEILWHSSPVNITMRFIDIICACVNRNEETKRGTI